MPSWVLALTPLWAAIGGALVVGVFRLVERLRGERTAAPPTWPEMWERMDGLEERMRTRDQAFLSIVATFADAWPADAMKPDFDQHAIAVLDDTLPPWFLTRHRRPKPST